MAERRGEFQETPVVREALEVPLRRRRPTGWIVATIVFAVIAAGAIGFMLVGKKDTQTTVNCVTEVEKVEPVKEDTEKEEVVEKGYVYSPEAGYGDYYITKNGDAYYVPSFSTSSSEDAKDIIKDDSALGKKSKYEFKYEDFRDVESSAEDGETFVIEGYKLDLENVAAVTEVQLDCQDVCVGTIFIDQDGNLSILTIFEKQEEVTYVLHRNIEKMSKR